MRQETMMVVSLKLRLQRSKPEYFTSALEQYEEEDTAFKVAWSALKRDYEKGEDGNWHKKPE
ncbi:ChaB family protein [Microcoleus sp. FACHB-53]|jgi:cation transport regulator ChaB|nr:ChaB family protein [Microcoleus sp. FACHB-53]MBD2126881.1 ChaB family protein [Microcoleus sp. FACHB-1]